MENIVLSGVTCRCNADVASYRKGNSRRNSGDPVTRWACDLKMPSSNNAGIEVINKIFLERGAR